ncbi:MAG: YicC/YloC family endoribonuclease [Anaerovoracaceae bacterium]
MVKSMTGFGRSEYTDEKRIVTAEIRSVNHRYCDITVRMPRRYSFAEEKIKSTIKEVVRRGKIEVSIMVENTADDDVNIRLNTAIAQQYVSSLAELKEALGMDDPIRLEYIASMPDVLKSVPDVEDEDEITKILCSAVADAVKRHDEMRSIEGQRLADDILMRGGLIRELVKEIEERSPETVKEYAAKLKSRIQEMIGGNVVATEERILLEAAVFADKVNVTEETVRLSSHIRQLESIITESSQPDGKKLDFLVQEMNREANTIGSKANDIEITNRVLAIKSEIEKIREQVQNIE